MNMTLGQAAKHLGVSKPTISKAIHSGKLSADRREDGSFAINPAELERYKTANEHRFQESRKETVRPLRSETPSDPATETGLLQTLRERLELEARAKLAEERLADLKLQLEEMRTQRDKWQQQAERLALPAPAKPASGILMSLFRRSA